MTASVNALWQGYLMAVGWVADHPHKTFWLAIAAIVAVLVF